MALLGYTETLLLPVTKCFIAFLRFLQSDFDDAMLAVAQSTAIDLVVISYRIWTIANKYSGRGALSAVKK